MTPKLRDLTPQEIHEFGLWEGCTPTFLATDEVWSLANSKNTITYGLCYKGTNGLVVLKYVPDDDKWYVIDIRDIPNLYGFVWKMIAGYKMKGWGWKE